MAGVGTGSRVVLVHMARCFQFQLLARLGWLALKRCCRQQQLLQSATSTLSGKRALATGGLDLFVLGCSKLL